MHFDELKRPAFNVVLLRWPRDGDEWIHPDDRCLAQHLLPSDRVFRWEGTQERYNVFSYGHRVLRIESVLWLEVPQEGFAIGDQVEVLSRMGKNWPRIGFISEIRWREIPGRVVYQIRTRTRLIPTTYSADDLRRIEHFDRSYAGLDG